MRSPASRSASLLLLALAAAAPAEGPAPGPLTIVSAGNAGCIAGAVQLPDEGPGWETIRRGRSAFWGAPVTVAGVETLAARARAAGLPTLYVGDLSRPRGGPIPGGHAAHETGLDADIYLDVTPRPALDPAAREAIEPPSLLRPDGRGVDPARWRPEHATLLRLAATLPGVDRVLVNPAIKRALCDEVTGERAWLRRIRPWWGHAAHMHIHFACPADQPLCHADPPPPPPGDGCDATLQWWFDQPLAPPAPATPRPPPAPPPACRAILDAP